MTNLHDLHSDVVRQILRHIDGPTLAAASCSSPLLRSLASDPAFWRHLCLSTWPSLAHPRLLPLLSRPRRFFSQTSPFPVSGFAPSAGPTDSGHDGKDVHVHDGAGLPAEIISAVDICHRGVPVLSRVVETDTSSSWFLTSPFRVDGLDRKDPDHADADRRPAVDPDELTLSWTVVDPATCRAVNLSSRWPVSVDRHWYTCETLVRYAVVVGGCAANVVVTCGEGAGHVREVVLTVEDLDGRSVSGRESLGVLKAAMEGGRRGAKWEEEIVGNYGEFLRRRRRERRERKVRREGMLDLCCTAFGALMFLILVTLMFFR